MYLYHNCTNALYYIICIGIAGGAFTIVAPVYVAECSDPDVRGKLSVGFDFGIAAGILYV
jgi:hypothetical protein